MITLLGILTGVVLGTRYKVFCLVPVTLAGTAILVVLDQINGVAAGSTTLSALALAGGLQIGYLVGGTIRTVLPAALSISVNDPERLRDQPARVS